jgi:uncharacterized protein YlxP (DUF503 family)
VTGFISVLEIHLHFPDNASLKGKRKELQSVKSQLRQKFGVSVSETDQHELWQLSTLTVAMAARTQHDADECADKIQRWLDAQFPQGVRVERATVSTHEVLH